MFFHKEKKTLLVWEKLPLEMTSLLLLLHESIHPLCFYLLWYWCVLIQAVTILTSLQIASMHHHTR